MEDLLRPVTGNRAPQVAGILLAKFGSISRIKNASHAAVEAALDGDCATASTICAARNFAETANRERLVGEKIDVRSFGFQAYLASRLCNHGDERLLAIFLTHDGIFISEETYSSGTFDGIKIRPRHILQRAFDLSARQILIAHNHPSGDARPSEQDIIATQGLASILRAVEIGLVDHLIEGRGEFFSIREGRLLG